MNFMVSDRMDLTLDDLLGGDGHTSPIVDNVDVLITGEQAASLTDSNRLASEYGIRVAEDGSFLNLDKSWTPVEGRSEDTQTFSNGALTLETTLHVQHTNPDEETVQSAVIAQQLSS